MREYSIKLSLLDRLADGAFHSGQSLGEQLGMSRAAISKHIQGIQEWGVDIFRVQGKGYQLAEPLTLLNQKVIQSEVENTVELCPIIDSTNQYLLDRIGQLNSGSVCLAEYQQSGRGRRGRQWVSPFGANLYFSMYWRLDAGMAAAVGLSLVVGVAVVEALEQMGFSGVKLKWPNDLYFKDRKLAGILVEMTGQAGGAANLVIGIGMNIAMQEKENEIDQPWTSLAQVSKQKRIDRNQLAIQLIKALNEALQQYQYTGMQNFVERWNRLDNFIDRQVRLIIGPQEIVGIERGIDSHGGVLLETKQGIQSYIGGEISLRKNEPDFPN
ncbi:bifunctional biotin--[acetyl-CoA-carboxylase] ligase/biotin operon repressor BirA [Vibrio sp. V27_P1S3P104]|uniref:bifunctional biotin--[acetyl-CoA-carboxylase] ligase/biotin operon repressor BirA n=1 Tax=unclassified Vibrio TaxID=2614977 RepID=UPI0013723C0E|nr:MULTISPECIES: bifunctional biotin--[acetyl-CoA-carboxylase] ligase/biotin operon repressor BirA [unclassified Vibrio]NAW70050.1 bifunctional biotin--[acetyl-CoA-carboxylase] ligase/biotin operon repressor BirA [Vibrio sp. V28_P6S34P95]NAX06638.1 bifunctional biotin--[acetyl-CoA-carboxylase] ligase/biotin operon repressor BirA [Vibrio sp. V30_P3S12P165]NAX33174.1 bifunctional biotin--[acetyl-CoA-carboxylase] ligase/biotin operon repressor BirA [Vibrio sp. V29_P1S30P107]NAX37204.1 bifunctional